MAVCRFVEESWIEMFDDGIKGMPEVRFLNSITSDLYVPPSAGSIGGVETSVRAIDCEEEALTKLGAGIPYSSETENKSKHDAISILRTRLGFAFQSRASLILELNRNDVFGYGLPLFLIAVVDWNY